MEAGGFSAKAESAESEKQALLQTPPWPLAVIREPMKEEPLPAAVGEGLEETPSQGLDPAFRNE